MRPFEAVKKKFSDITTGKPIPSREKLNETFQVNKSHTELTGRVTNTKHVQQDAVPVRMTIGFLEDIFANISVGYPVDQMRQCLNTSDIENPS